MAGERSRFRGCVELSAGSPVLLQAGISDSRLPAS